MTIPTTAEAMIAEMELLKAPVLNNIRILAPYNRRDYYYRELMELARREYFFETYQVIAWAGLKLRPRRILEIGTRNGGSLVQLLSMYQDFTGVEVTCFDLWREIGGPWRVRRNLRKLNIPTGMIQFISGDSGQTVPIYKREHPQAKFDYVLVDGGHEPETARTDLKNVADLVAPGGILIFDDICPESYNLIGVWREFQAAHRDEFLWFEKLWRKGVAWGIRR